MTESLEGRRPHDPNDSRGGGGPGGGPDSWPTTRVDLGPMKSQEHGGPESHEQAVPEEGPPEEGPLEELPEHGAPEDRPERAAQPAGSPAAE